MIYLGQDRDRDPDGRARPDHADPAGRALARISSSTSGWVSRCSPAPSTSSPCAAACASKRDEGRPACARRDGGRRGHAATAAHLEPAQADGADLRQAVHRAHRRAAAQHGIHDVVVTLAFLPQVIRGYLGDGTLAGRAPRVLGRGAARSAPPARCKNAKELLDDTFVVISGDALCDFDLGEIVEFHRERGALATLALKSVDNPLEFGVVIVDEEGRIERFLEKPSWGQVFSDTINTGIYVIEPEVLAGSRRASPSTSPSSCSPSCWPRAQAALRLRRSGGRVLAGHRDARAVPRGEPGRARRPLSASTCPGIRLKENIWLGDGVALPGVDVIDRPAFLGHTRRSRRARPSARTRCSARTSRSSRARRSSARVIDGGTYIGGGAVVRGAIVGRNCDIRAHARIDAGAAIGDECSIGEESLIAPERAGLPVQDDRGRRPDPAEPVWESRGVSIAVLARRGRGHRQRRRDARGRGAARPGVRDARSSAATVGRLARRPPGGTHDQAGDDRRPQRRPACTSQTCASPRPRSNRH